MKIKAITYKELEVFKNLRNLSVDFKHNPKTSYIGAFSDDGEIMGVVGWMKVGKNLRYKTDCVLPKYRGMGVYSALWKEREFLCERQASVTTAFCTDMSIGMYLAHGFMIAREGKIKFVTRNNR